MSRRLPWLLALAAAGAAALFWRHGGRTVRRAGAGGGGVRSSVPPIDPVDTASEDSFPASDPPGYTMSGRVGSPQRGDAASGKGG